jgi:Zn-dependent protease with chaperone function
MCSLLPLMLLLLLLLLLLLPLLSLLSMFERKRESECPRGGTSFSARYPSAHTQSVYI